MQSCTDVAPLICPHVQETEVSWSTEKVFVPSTGRQWSCPFIWFLCLFLSSIIHHCSTVTALATVLTKMLFNKSMWDSSFRVFLQRGAGSFGFDMAMHFPGIIYTNYTSLRGDITNQPSSFRKLLHEWDFILMTLRESVRAARSPVAKPSNLCHRGRRDSRADEAQEEDWEFQFLSCPFLVILNGALLHGNASLPKRAGMWKLVLIFRRHSDVKVVWYRTTLKVKMLDSEGSVFPSQTDVLYFSSVSQNL